MYIMNIFVLDKDPTKAAQLQFDKHVVKMIVESGQMLSTAHRVLDGTLERLPSKSGKTMVKHYVLDDVEADLIYYKAVHYNHPCTLWTMESEENYRWHWEHMYALCLEYRHRYNKLHKSETVLWALRSAPDNIPKGPMTPFRLAMKSNPECMFPEDPVKSYRLFYETKQERFKMRWTKREVPEWFRINKNANI